MQKGTRLSTVQAAGKTLELLELLIVGGERLRIGELALRLEVSRQEALLFLVTLESRGIVRWDHQARVYRPGFKALELARQLPAPALPVAEAASRGVTTRAGSARKLRPERRRAAASAC
jgi:DNA-binding IclR family transcriptional regulator